MIYYRTLSLIIFTLLIGSCVGPAEQTNENSNQSTPLKETTINFAKGFNIVQENGITKMHILNPFSNYEIENTFVLLKKGQQYPEKKNEIKITVPIKSIAPMSATFFTSITELNQVNSIVAIANSNFIFSPQILSRCTNEKIAQIGDSQGLNIEKLILLYPDVIVVNGYKGGLDKSYAKTQEAGIPVILNYDWKEATPLARAEWIKFFGALYSQEKLADSIFNQIAENYKNYKSALDTVKNQPSILFSSSYQGTWYMPGGKSYIAEFLKDAKGTYPWSSDSTTGSLPLSIEVVANKMLDADIWIDSQGFSLMDLKKKDIRYTHFKPYKEGNIYEHDRRITKTGGNDYWEMGALRVDLLLKDYINILHPKILKDQSLTFFRKLE